MYKIYVYCHFYVFSLNFSSIENDSMTLIKNADNTMNNFGLNSNSTKQTLRKIKDECFTFVLAL